MPTVPDVELSCVKNYDKANCTDYDKAALAVREKLQLNLKSAHHNTVVLYHLHPRPQAIELLMDKTIGKCSNRQGLSTGSYIFQHIKILKTKS